MAGLGAQLGRRWVVPAVAAIGLAAGSGLVLAAGDPSAFADAVMVTERHRPGRVGGAGRLDGVFLSGSAITGGIWLRLADADVRASEPYLLPVAALLLGAGLRARSIGTSSWIAYGPVVALLGGVGLAERMAGGPGWHARGGRRGRRRRRGGRRRTASWPLPCSSGTGAARGPRRLRDAGHHGRASPRGSGSPLGGTALLGAGVAMERNDLGPLETGRRLVDVVTDEYV